MANPVRGEVEFEADGQTYTMVLDFNALCDLEGDFPGIMSGGVELSSPRAVRSVFRSALAKHHPGIEEREAGDLIQIVGIAQAAELVANAFKASFPAEAPKGGKTRPPAK